MLKKILFILVSVTFSGMLVACGEDDSVAEKVDEPKKENKAEDEETEENGTGLEVLQGKDLEEITAEDWEKVNLSKKQFDKFIKSLTEPDKETGEITINKAEMPDDKTILFTLNNSDGDTLENSIMVPFMDALIRQIYKHSKYFKDEEPTIKYSDLTGYTIAEVSEPIEFDETEFGASGQDLGTFKIGDMVDIAGTVITITGSSYTDERNQFEDSQPEKVLIVDMTVQNATQEELFFNAFDLEIYDAEGTKMETYPIDYLTETLQPGKNVSGRGAYGVSGNGPYEVYYTDFLTGTKAMWNIDVN